MTETVTLKDLFDEVLDSLNYSKQLEIEGKDDGSLFKQLVGIAATVKGRLGHPEK